MAGMARMAMVGMVATFCEAAAGQAPPSYDFDFATIGAVNNAPFPGGSGPFPVFAGRGSVNYEYRIARTEVSTAQWLEFVNTYTVLGGAWSFFGEPVFWGAEPDPAYSGPGTRWRLNSSIGSAAELPVGGISWREAAQYCNWLHNDKGTALSAIESGAYDTSTFGSAGGTLFTDQQRHHPDAKFWIPTLDEWLKAVHFDPDRYGPGHAGWWDYSYSSDTPPTSGLPGSGQTSAGQTVSNAWLIPLGAYADMRSPWGLWDTSGGVSELTEEVFTPEFPSGRMVKGSAFGTTSDMEPIWGFSTVFPSTGAARFGLRVASAVPTPSTVLCISPAMIFPFRRRRGRPSRPDRHRIHPLPASPGSPAAAGVSLQSVGQPVGGWRETVHGQAGQDVDRDPCVQRAALCAARAGRRPGARAAATAGAGDRRRLHRRHPHSPGPASC